jgi:hypothetical protein
MRRAPCARLDFIEEQRGLRGIRSPDSSSRPQTVWASLDSRTPSELIANLRAVGCPERTIRDIVVLRICREYRARMKAADAAVAAAWDFTRMRSRREWQESNNLKQEVRAEMTARIEDLFDLDWAQISQEILGWPRSGMTVNDYLSREKQRELSRIDREYRRARQDLNLEMKEITGDVSAADRASVHELEVKRQGEIAALLTPSELEQYRYRQSAAAEYARANLPEAKSEAEFRAMVRVVEEFGMQETTGSFGLPYGFAKDADSGLGPEQQRQEAFDRRLREVLGEDRIAEQATEEDARAEEQRKQREAQQRDRERIRIINLAAESGIPQENAAQFFERVFGEQERLKEHFETLEKSLTGTPEEKQKRMEAEVRAELERIALDTIGNKGSQLIEKILQRGK